MITDACDVSIYGDVKAYLDPSTPYSVSVRTYTIVGMVLLDLHLLIVIRVSTFGFYLIL